jgi:hypothetical protein
MDIYLSDHLSKRDQPRSLIAFHGPLGLNCQPLEKANTIANCLKNQFRPHDLRDENHKRWAKARVQALLGTADSTSLEK